MAVVLLSRHQGCAMQLWDLTYHCSKVSGSMTWDAVEFDGPALN